MTEQELNQLCRDIIDLGDKKEMLKGLMSLPDEQREKLVEYVLTVKGTPWKSPVDQ
mgnify:CR=1 FL=1